LRTDLPAWDWPALQALCRREAMRVLRSPEDADDAAQDAMARAWTYRAKCATPERPAAWVAQIARREALRRLARRERVRRTEVFLDHEDREQWATSDDRLPSPAELDIRRALTLMRPDDRKVVVLRYLLDLSQPDVAASLGIPEGTAKIRLHRARQRLRDLAESS
jgi:RNA polymerase sigma-70 factor (ECF subfamily)